MDIDVIKRIKDLTAERGWTEYRLVKESGIAASTISNIFHRNTLPNIFTLEALCDTFGITLSQFFSNDVMIYPSEDQEAILLEWSYLNTNQRERLLSFLRSMRECSFNRTLPNSNQRFVARKKQDNLSCFSCNITCVRGC